jgi:polysaccharide biosynthesis/export protein ExoF
MFRTLALVGVFGAVVASAWQAISPGPPPPSSRLAAATAVGVGASATAPIVPVSVAVPAVRPLAAAPVAATPVAATPDCGNPVGSKGLHVEIGDHIKLTFYERIDDAEANKWNKGVSGMQGFEMRPEFSGAYTVEDNGTLMIPLLGSFPIANRSAEDLNAEMLASFEKLTNHKGFVTISFTERPQVYVLGPVKTPGAYKYAAGMTVLHVIAMAGGQPNTAGGEPWQQIEVVRENIRRQNTNESLAQLLTRQVVLKAERDQPNADHVTVSPSLRLIQLVGDAEAKRLVDTEVEKRSAIVTARHYRSQIAQQQLDLLKAEVQAMNRTHPYDALVKMRAEHADAYKALVANGVVSRPAALVAQTELVDAQMRQQDSTNQLQQAQMRVTQLQQDLAKAVSDMRSDLDNTILTIDQQISENERATVESTGVLTVMNANVPNLAANAGNVRRVNSTGGATDNPLGYQIVRQTPNGPTVIAANEMTVLRPGDLVRIGPTGGADQQPSTTTPSSATSISAPGGCDPDPNANPSPIKFVPVRDSR